MSTLVVDYGMESSFHKSIKSAKSALNKRVDDYVNIEHRVRSIPSNTDNCSNCAYYVRKKYQQLQNKIERLNNLDRQVDNFINEAQNVDKRVASRIKKDTQSFKKRSGIGKSNKSVFASISEIIGGFFDWVGDGVSGIWNAAKDWVIEFYEKNKYIINIVVDAALVIGAVAACLATGGISLAFFVSAFSVLDAVCDYVYDIAAYQYHKEGYEAEAERLSEKGGKDAYMWVGRKFDEAVGTDFAEGAMGVVHTGLSIFAIGYSIYKTGAQILKDLKLDIKVKTLFNGNRNKIKWSSHFNKENITKAVKNYFGFKNVKQKDVMKLRWKKVLGFKIGEKLIKTPEFAERLLKLKIIYKGSKKVYKTISKFYTNYSSKNYNPFTKTTKAVTEFYNDIIAVPSGGA